MSRPADDKRTRQIAFALIQTPYRPPSRNDGLEFVAGLSDRGIPDLSYRYSENLQRDGTPVPSLTLAAQEGRAKTEIKIDFFNGALRLFLNFLFPSSREVAIRQADAIYDLFAQKLGAGLDAQMVEVRVAVDVPTQRGTAMANLGRRFFGHETLKLLGNVDFTCVIVKTAAEEREATGNLDNPSREIKIEKLLEDSRRIFIETVNQWSKLSQVIKSSDDVVGQASVHLFPGPLHLGLKKPSDYVEEASEFIEKNVIAFVNAGRADQGQG